MKKLQLDIEKLDVESFDTTDANDKPRGTVFGAESELGSCVPYCTFNCGYSDSCDPAASCGCTPPTGFRACFNDGTSNCG